MPSDTRTLIPLSAIGRILSRGENYGRRNRAKYGAVGNPGMVSIERFEALHGPRPAEFYDRICGQQPSAPPPHEKFGALDVEAFLAAYSLSRSTMYREAKAGRLVVRKRGDRCVILVSEAEQWARQFPRAEYGEQW